MGLSVLRRILQKGGGAGFCRSAGVFGSPTHCSFCGVSCCNYGAGILRRPNSCCGSKLGGGRMMSSSVIVNNWLPLLMVPPLFDDSGRVVNKFHVVGNKEEISYPSKRSGCSSGDIEHVEVVGSSHGWLAMYNRVNHDMFILNPITGRRIKLPSLRTLPNPEVTLTGGVSRVVLSCSPDTYLGWLAAEDIGRAMMIFGGARRLAFCVPGRSKEWTPLEYARKSKEEEEEEENAAGQREYEDIVQHLSQFICLTRNPTELEGWNVTNPQSPRMEWAARSNFLKFDRDRDRGGWPSRSEKDSELKKMCWSIKYIVPAMELYQLYLVVRHVNPRMRPDGAYKTIDFDVYRLNMEGLKLSYMKASLDGLAMFVGTNLSCGLDRRHKYMYPELNPNCIYFSDDNRLMRRSRSFVQNEYGGHDNGIFDYQNNTFSTCCGNCPLDHPHVERIERPPLWLLRRGN